MVFEDDFIFDEVFENTDKPHFIGIHCASVNNLDVDVATSLESSGVYSLKE